MVLEKYSKNVKKRTPNKQFSYKKSRSVQFTVNHVDSGTEPSKVKKNTKVIIGPRRSKRIHNLNKEKPKKCPGAPHNTTSFLINFHKRDSSNDLLGRYRGVVSDCDRYEVESVMQT
jgi:hypothetical protein